MAWRPTRCLLQGELDNTKPLQVTGWMRFAGMSEKVTFNLKGDFHRDIRGAKICFAGDGADAGRYMSCFAAHQTGDVGDITAGLPPRDYVDYPYIEWYSDQNGRVVIELEPEQVQLIGTAPPPARFGTVVGTVDCAKQRAFRKPQNDSNLRDARCAKRRGGDSNPRYRYDPVRRFSKPLL